MENAKENEMESLVKKIFNGELKGLSEVMKYVIEKLMEIERDNEIGYTYKSRKNKTVQNKRNGYYEVKGIINQLKGYKLRIPRDRLGKYKPLIIEIIKKEEKVERELIYELYVKGLTTRDVSDVIEKIYNNKISSTSVTNICKEYKEVIENWLKRPLEAQYISIYMDALYIPVRRESVAKEAFYILMGLKNDGTREILDVVNNPSENLETVEEILKNLKERGVKEVLTFVTDGVINIENKIRKLFPNSDLQKCQIHKMRNIQNKVRADYKKEVLKDYKNNVLKLDEKNYAIGEAKFNLKEFINRWKSKYDFSKMFKEEEIDYYFTYLKYPFEIRRMIYTTNWIENINSILRRTLKIRISFSNADSAVNLICAYLMEIEDKNYMKYKVTSVVSVLPELLNRFQHPSHNIKSSCLT